nr:GNAT family N-acetyltransferase [uncultured Rhodopila sp.]
MAAIHAAAFPPPDAWRGDVFSQQLGLPGVFGLLHPSGGMILARVASDEAEILTLAVAPEARGFGIAAALLQQTASICAALGASAIFLEVSVTNTAARAAYDSAGFQPAGRRRAYYADGSDALVLRLRLRDAG